MGARVAYDPAGPAGVFGDDLAKHGIQSIPISGRDLAHACSLFFDAVIDRNDTGPHDGALNAAVAAAATTIAYFAVQRGVDPVANVH
jgi:hypothetical protein